MVLNFDCVFVMEIWGFMENFLKQKPKIQAKFVIFAKYDKVGYLARTQYDKIQALNLEF